MTTEIDQIVKVRLRGWVLASALWFPMSTALAGGLGDLTIRSPLDAPLIAEINLLEIDPSELEMIRVKFASDLAFRHAGIERIDVLDEIVFRPSIREDGSPMVEVVSRTPIGEQYLHFLITLDWKGVQTVREYILLLDPGIYGTPTPAKISGPKIPTAELISQFSAVEGLSGRLNLNASAGSPYGPVKRREYLIAIGNALDISNNISIYQRLYAILRDNPHAFIHRNMNLLRAGVVLDIPTAEQMAAVSRVLAMETFIRQVAEWQEYRLKFGRSPEDVDGSSEMAVMKATMLELEEEILRLRQQLVEAIAQQSQAVENSTNEAEYRKQLEEDIRRLEAARDRLLETIDGLSDSPELAGQGGSDPYVLGVSQSDSGVQADVPDQSLVEITTDSERDVQDTETLLPASGESEKIVANGEKIPMMEQMLLSRKLENKQLQEQVFLLKKQVQKAVALLGVRDEALALAQQEAAVYGAALEALESPAVDEQKILAQGNEGLGAEKAEASATATNVIDKPEIVLVRDKGIVDRGLSFIFDGSNRPVLFLGGAALLLLLFIAMRRRRYQREGVLGETSAVIETTSPMIGPADDSDVASKLDLARAYVEMGDDTAARELLFEIAARGDADQQREAERLRDSLDD